MSRRCWADYDNDGFPDLFLANASQKNSLYHNNGDGTFTSITDSAVVTDALPAANDFFPVARGVTTTTMASSISSSHTATATAVSGVLQPRHNLLYHNNGDGTFTKVTDGSVVTDPVTQCSGASWGDYDNDGFLDLFVSQGAFGPIRRPTCSITTTATATPG